MSDRIGERVWAILCWVMIKSAGGLAGGTAEPLLFAGAFGGAR
jgi:hypothetical protein